MIPSTRNIFQQGAVYSEQLQLAIRKFCLSHCLPLIEGYRRMREEDIALLEYVQQHVMPIS